MYRLTTSHGPGTGQEKHFGKLANAIAVFDIYRVEHPKSVCIITKNRGKDLILGYDGSKVIDFRKPEERK